MARAFCRDHSCALSEPLAGTGKMPDRFLLLRWPRAKWRSPRHLAVGMEPELAAAVKLAFDEGLHVALCDRSGDSDSLADLTDPQTGRQIWRASQVDLARAIDTFREGGSLPGPADGRISVMVCTDSRRDPCCAKHGFATWRALDAAADPARFRIVQTTHLGGCRFAATLIVLPVRERYGRLTAEEAPAFLQTIGRGEVYLPAFRGHSALNPVAQVAHLAALQASGSFLSVETHVDGDSATCDVTTAMGRVRVDLKRRVLPVFTNCENMAEDHAAHEAHWLPVQVSPASIAD